MNKQNFRQYIRKLRRMKAGYMARVADLPDLNFKCATIHGGYDYLLQEFGLQVTAVIEPGHGLKPSATQLAETIEAIRALNVDVIFTEMDFPEPYVETIHQETGVRVRHLSHLTHGEYTPGSFESGIRANLEALTGVAIGVLIGSILTVNNTDMTVLFVISIPCLTVGTPLFNLMLLESFNPSLAHARGINAKFMDYCFILMITVITVAALKFVGAVLVEALFIIPAAAARNVSRSINGFFGFSVAIATVSCILGIIVPIRNLH